LVTVGRRLAIGRLQTGHEHLEPRRGRAMGIPATAAAWRRNLARMGVGLVLCAVALMPGTLPVEAAAPASAPNVGLGSAILSGYTRPVLVAFRGNNLAYIVEQTGRIKVAHFDAGAGHWVKEGTFLNLHPLVARSDEQGLLGMAFSPHYGRNGKFYVDYTRSKDGATVVAEYRRSTKLKANPNSARVLFRVHQPFDNHNGGNLAFHDGYLYIGLGDGGSGGDPGNRAQDLGTRLGKILRIKPRDPDGNGPLHFTTPSGNPFVGVGGDQPEIWAYGLRNPWRFSFDRSTGDLWIADVGQDQYEEIDHDGGAKGDNFGWHLLEGSHLFDPDHPGASEPVCTTDCKTLPVAEYTHDEGCAVTGGYVYRGTDYPAWQGHYLYGDYCSGKMWEIPASGSPGSPVDVSPGHAIHISSFAQDKQGELYAVNLGGSIYKLKLTGTP
jgi:glucose/arabinose dehydrogenase